MGVEELRRLRESKVCGQRASAFNSIKAHASCKHLRCTAGGVVVCERRFGDYLLDASQIMRTTCARQRMHLVMASREAGVEISRGSAPHTCM